MKLGSISKINGEYQWIELSETEAKKAIDELRAENEEEFKRCLESAERITPVKGSVLAIRIAAALFEKQGTASYTKLVAELDKKKHKLKKESRSAVEKAFEG